MNGVEKVLEYLDKTGMFFVTTLDGGHPKCRPFSFKMEYDGKIYFGVGTFKECYRQLAANPNVEICASDGKGFLRYYGKAVFVDDKEILAAAFKSADYLEKMYNPETGRKLRMFYLADATAEFRNLFSIEESIKM